MRENGRALLLALYTQDRWIIRTVDSVRFVDQNTVRRRIVCHFGLPSDPESRPKIAGQVWLPVFTLPKGSFISCDLRDESDRRIALRPIQERWDLTFYAFMALIEAADPELGQDSMIRGLARNLISCTLSKSDDHHRQLIEFYRSAGAGSPGFQALVLNDEFANLVQYLAKNYLVYVGVDKDGPGSHMISYRIEQRFADRPRDFIGARMPRPRRRRLRRTYGLEPHVYFHPWAVSGAGSSHLEIEAPEGVDLGMRRVHLPKHGSLDHPGTSRRNARFLAPRTLPGGEAFAQIDIHPGVGVMRSGGPAVGALFCLLLTLMALREVENETAAALLLFLPGFASVIAARPNENPYVTRVVRGVRYLTLFPIPLSALAVAVLVTGLSKVLLWPLVLAGMLVTGVLAYGARKLKTQPAYTEHVLDDLTRIA